MPHVLVATGRIPNIDKLRLENIPMKLDARGLSKVDSQTMRIIES